MIDNALRMIVGLLVGVWVARYLGAEQFGQISYATSLVALFGTLAGLGLQGIVVRDIVRDEARAGITLGSALVLRLIAGLASYGLILSIVFWLMPQDDLTKTLVAIIGFTLVLQASQVVRSWFESQVQSHYVVWVNGAVLLMAAAVKAALILAGAPLILFAWVILADALFIAIGLFSAYALRARGQTKWCTSLGRARELLADSWPLIFSSVAISINMKFDILMINEFLGAHEVGIYAAAMTPSAALGQIVFTLARSAFPDHTKLHGNQQRFVAVTTKMLRYLSILALAIAGTVLIFKDWIISTVYGVAYADAAMVLAILMLNVATVGIDASASNYFRIKNLQKKMLQRQLVTLVINISLNLVLIPVYGIVGAATATVIATTIPRIVWDFFDRDLVEWNAIKLAAVGLRTNAKRTS